MEQGTEDVELVGGGWNGRIAKASGFSTKWHEVPFQWTEVRIVELALTQTPALLVMQGLKLQELFPMDSWFRRFDLGLALKTGLHVFLRGELTPIHQPPLRLKNVILGHLDFIPEELTREELLATLIRQLQ